MNKRLRLRLILVSLFYALMFTYAGVNAYQIFKLTRSDPGWAARRAGTRVRISRVTPGGSASALHTGDDVISVNGQPDEHASLASTYSLNPGEPYTMVVERDGQRLEFNFRTVTVSLSLWLILLTLAAFLPAIFLSTGLTVFLLKPFNKQALLLALTFGLFVPPMAYHWFNGLPALLAAVLYVGPLVTPLAFFLILHFFLIFPEPSPVLRRFPRLEWSLYLPYFLLILPSDLAGALPRGIAERYAQIDNLGWLVINLNFAFAFLSLIVNYRRANKVAKRKMRVVVAGMIAGMLPGIIVFFTLPWFDFSRISPTVGEWLPVVAALAFSLMPLSFAYAIVRHQVIPVSLMIRRSVQYLLAKNALRILLALPAIGIILTIYSNPNRTLSEIIFHNSLYFYLLVIAAAAVGLRYRKKLTIWIDRKFFREHYDRDKILRDLVDEVKRADSISEMSRRVSEQVERSLHPEHLYLFYREEERPEFSLGYSSGGSTQRLSIPEEFRLLRFMEDQGGALDFPFPQKNNLPQGEKEWLARLGTNLIVPMTGTDNRLAGLFLLGPKKSEVPYTANDRELLETLADQIAIVYENVRLKERVDRERKVRYEVLTRIEKQNISLLKECPTCGACFDGPVQTCPNDRSELTLTLPVERTIEGRYRLDRLLGRGGMGAVYEAMDLRLSRRVAIKILTGSMFGNRDALRRFEREAQASARLSHRNIITVYDYGVLSTEGAYLVMELVRGQTLSAAIKRGGQIPKNVAADLFDQILEDVKAAHQASIVHRDLKPENIFITQDDDGRLHVKILDFGLAKITQPEVVGTSDGLAPVTTPGTIMGTFGYMSPEQLTGAHVDHGADIFSLGVIVVEALTGQRPFTGRTYHELLSNILQSEFHIRGSSPEIRQLDEVLQKCLAKERERRYSSAVEMQKDLIPAIRRCPTLSSHEPTNPEAETFIFES